MVQSQKGTEWASRWNVFSLDRQTVTRAFWSWAFVIPHLNNILALWKKYARHQREAINLCTFSISYLSKHIRIIHNPSFFFFLGSHLQHMEVPRLGVQLELHPLAYTTATATPDPSRICNLHHSSWQCWVLNPLSKARERTLNLMVPSWIRFHCATTGTPYNHSKCKKGCVSNRNKWYYFKVIIIRKLLKMYQPGFLYDEGYR